MVLIRVNIFHFTISQSISQFFSMSHNVTALCLSMSCSAPCQFEQNMAHVAVLDTMEHLRSYLDIQRVSK